jgi:hypothetical protein
VNRRDVGDDTRRLGGGGSREGKRQWGGKRGNL